MKVAIVTHNVCRGDGQGRVNYELARHCLASGIHTTLLSDVVAPDLIEAGASWVQLSPRWKKPNLAKTWNFAAMADRAVSRMRDVDVVVANGFVLRRPHTVNVSHFVHGAWSRSSAQVSKIRSGLRGAYQRQYTRCNARWERHSYDAAGIVVAVSAKVKDELVSIGVRSERIRVLVNGVDLDEFRPGPFDRKALGLPTEVPLALFAGDIRTPRKNLDSVLRALTQVPALHLAVVGDANQSPYPAMANELNLKDRVHFLGFRRDVSSLMRAADLFVFPSRYDPFGLVVLEAMASGLPVITAVTAGASELVGVDAGTVLEDPEDVDALATAMKRFVDSAELRQRCGQAARETAERHGWRDMASRYLQLFEEARP